MSDFHPLEVVGRGSDTQLQVRENLNYLIYPFKGYYSVADLENVVIYLYIGF